MGRYYGGYGRNYGGFGYGRGYGYGGGYKKASGISKSKAAQMYGVTSLEVETMLTSSATGHSKHGAYLMYDEAQVAALAQRLATERAVAAAAVEAAQKVRLAALTQQAAQDSHALAQRKAQAAALAQTHSQAAAQAAELANAVATTLAAQARTDALMRAHQEAAASSAAEAEKLQVEAREHAKRVTEQQATDATGVEEPGQEPGAQAEATLMPPAPQLLTHTKRARKSDQENAAPNAPLFAAGFGRRTPPAKARKTAVNATASTKAEVAVDMPATVVPTTGDGALRRGARVRTPSTRRATV